MHMEIKPRIDALLKALSKGLYEREEILSLSLLAAVAGESVFLFGPPGVGKSLVARRLKFAFDNAASFEYLMSRFSTPDEIFGPVSIKKLKDEDKYERLTSRYLPGAQIVFLDEIWKSGPAIQNALLTVLNERVYRNGEQEVAVNLHAVITASNELPADGDAASALYDRFLVRYQMQPLKSTRAFFRMITETDDLYEDPVPEALKIKRDELDAWSVAIDRVVIPDPVLAVIDMLRKQMAIWNEKQGAQARPIEALDRRWKKLIRLLRTSAFLNGRQTADLMDCFLLAHGLWSAPEQFTPLTKMLGEVIKNHGYSVTVGLQSLRKEISQLEAEVESETLVQVPETRLQLKPYDDRYYRLVKNGLPFEGVFLTVKEYNQLARGELTVMNYYDGQYKLVNRLQTKPADAPFEVLVDHNAQTHRLPLETVLEETHKTVRRKAHEMLIRHWNNRCGQLLAHIDAQEVILAEQNPENAGVIAGHLFVDDALVPYVRENFDHVVQQLKLLRLRIEKLQFGYEKASN
jgi:MoxR-like ATPase